jgi:hypothetical protein
MPPRHHLGLRRDEVVQLILKHSVPTVIKETRLLRIAQSFPKGIHRLEHHLPGRILEHRDISDNTSTETLIALAMAQLAKADNRLFEAVAACPACSARSTPFRPTPRRSKGGFKALPLKANS